MRFDCSLLSSVVCISKKSGRIPRANIYIYNGRLVRNIRRNSCFHIPRLQRSVSRICVKSSPPDGSPPKICVSKFKGFGRGIASNAGVQRRELLARVHLHLSRTFRRLGPTTGEFKQVYPQRCIGRVLWFSSKTRWEAIFRSTPGSGLIGISIGWPIEREPVKPPRSSTSHRNFELSFIANNGVFHGTKIDKICFVLRYWIS